MKYYGVKDFVTSSNKLRDKETFLTDNRFGMELKVILKSILKKKDISIAHLSRQAQVPLQTLHGWLSGNSPKNLEQVKRVADYLDVTLDHLCFGVENRTQINEYEDEINAGIFEVVLRRKK